MSEALTVRLVALLPPSLRSDVADIAKAQGRSDAAVVRSALAQYVAAWKRQNERKSTNERTET